MSKSVDDLFQKALRRQRRELVDPGPLIHDEDGAMARFAIDGKDGIVTGLDYRCTTCATLVALCELLSERALHQPVSIIGAWVPADLIAWLPGIPQSRWSRAEVALRALQSACH